MRGGIICFESVSSVLVSDRIEGSRRVPSREKEATYVQQHALVVSFNEVLALVVSWAGLQLTNKAALCLFGAWLLCSSLG